MDILCRSTDCKHHQLGACTLTRAAAAGTGETGCAYYTRRPPRTPEA